MKDRVGALLLCMLLGPRDNQPERALLLTGPNMGGAPLPWGLNS